MIAHFATALTLALLFLNLTGLALIANRFTGSYLLSRVVSPGGLVLALFFVEHFAGLGNLAWVWPLTTALSAYLIWRNSAVLRADSLVEVLFLVGFGYSFLWRFTFPSIGGSTEKLADLAMIRSYWSGTKLPPIDVWFPPYPFDVYYSLQHYAAALLGRVLSLDPGTSYNLGFCVLVGLTITAAGGTAAVLCRTRWHAVLLTAVFVVGGTGASPLVRFMRDNPQTHHSMRFIGGLATPDLVNRPFGRWLAGVSHVPRENAVELPSELFSYLIHLGDYHPPMAGFYLLTLGLLCIALEAKERGSAFSRAALGATIPTTMAADAWNLPLHFLLVGAFAACCWRAGKRATTPILAGLGVAALLLYPFLSRFGRHSLDFNVAVRLVSAGEHTPVLLGLILFYPVLLVLAAWLAFGERTALAPWLAGLWIAALVMSELILIDDVYSGKFNRFNTTLKWWPWIYSGTLLTVGAFNLNSASRWCRGVTLTALAATLLYAVDLRNSFFRTPKLHVGQLDAAGFITHDAVENAILEYLRAQPPAIVLQRMETDAFLPAPGLATFSGQTVFLGWPAHEKLWRGQRPDIEIRSAEIRAFYSGKLPNAGQWLIQNRIDHVLWLKDENRAGADFENLHEQIERDFMWREFYAVDSFRVGVWSRRIH